MKRIMVSCVTLLAALAIAAIGSAAASAEVSRCVATDEVGGKLTGEFSASNCSGTAAALNQYALVNALTVVRIPGTITLFCVEEDAALGANLLPYATAEKCRKLEATTPVDTGKWTEISATFQGKSGVGTTVTSKSAVEPAFVATGEGGKTVKVTCKKDTGSGEVASETSVLTSITYEECKNGAGNKVTVTNGCKFLLDLSGTVGIKGSGCTITVEAKTTGCVLTISGEQTIEGGAEYANTGEFTGEVKSSLKGVKYKTSTAKKCLLSESTESLEGSSEYTGTDDSEGVEVI